LKKEKTMSNYQQAKAEQIRLHGGREPSQRELLEHRLENAYRRAQSDDPTVAAMGRAQVAKIKSELIRLDVDRSR
jgi:hypothetical protein